MPLTNQQYDAIMRGYDRRQYQNYRTQRRRTEEVLSRLPQIGALEERISSCSLEHAQRLIARQEQEPDGNHRHILEELRAEEEKKRERVVEAKKDTSSIEKLKEKKLDAYHKAEAKGEELFIEEFVSAARAHASA